MQIELLQHEPAIFFSYFHFACEKIYALKLPASNRSTVGLFQ